MYAIASTISCTGSLRSMKVLAAVPALEILRSEVYGRLKFGDPSQPGDVLNRHWVAHGRAAAFGTPINACRTLMLVVALVELFDGAIALRASSAPVDAWALLDEHGPLAPLRAAAAQRCSRASRQHRAGGRIPPELSAEATPASVCLTHGARAGFPSL